MVDAVQLSTALWLLASPVVFPGPSQLAAVKDLVVGTLLLALTCAAAMRQRWARAQTSSLLVLGGVLIAGSVALEFGAGQAATARQWNEVVVGVVLICLAGARAR